MVNESLQFILAQSAINKTKRTEAGIGTIGITDVPERVVYCIYTVVKKKLAFLGVS